MLRIESKQSSCNCLLYNKIPENHILKQVENVVDFSFINDLLEDTYFKNFGRPAKEPELMCKLLFLQSIDHLSDEKLIEEATFNLAHLYFLGLNLEDALPEKSLLSKFRTQRLGEQTLDQIIIEIVRQCIEKGIIKDEGVSIDCTHVEANTIKKTPERLMKHLARNIYYRMRERTQASGLMKVNSPITKILINGSVAREIRWSAENTTNGNAKTVKLVFRKAVIITST